LFVCSRGLFLLFPIHAPVLKEKLEDFFVTLKKCVGETIASKKFPLVLGGDCSILVGVMAGLEDKEHTGLFFMDAHADCYLPEQSPTGEAADMELAIISGNAPGHFTDIDGSNPYLQEDHIIHMGQRARKRRTGTVPLIPETHRSNASIITSYRAGGFRIYLAGSKPIQAG